MTDRVMATHASPQHRPDKCSCTTTKTVDTMKPSKPQAFLHPYVQTWRQANELYRHRQLGDSAETFLILSETVSQEPERTMCLINAAIILTQLGDLHTATEALDTARPPGELVALVKFVLGHIEAQQSHFARAQDCFEMAVENLSTEPERKMDFRAFGLDFALSVADCRYHLFLMRSMKDHPFEADEGLGSLPVDALFTAPRLEEDDPQPPLSPLGAIFRLLSRSSTDSGAPTLTDQSISSSFEIPMEKSIECHDSGVWCLPRLSSNTSLRPPSPLRYSLFPRIEAKSPSIEIREIMPQPTPVDQELDGLRRIVLSDVNMSSRSLDTAHFVKREEELLERIIEEAARDGPAPLLPTKSPRRNTLGSRELKQYEVPAPSSPAKSNVLPNRPTSPAPMWGMFNMKSKRRSKKAQVSQPTKVTRPKGLSRTSSILSKMSWLSSFSRGSDGDKRNGYASVYQRSLEAQGVASFADFFGGFGRGKK